MSQKLLLLALVIAILSTTIIDIIIPLFLVEIAKTFHVTIATASQIRTYSEIAEILPALFLGFLAVRFKAKWLLIIGALCISLAAIGSYIAVNLETMQFFYSFNGIGSVLVSAMALAVVGEFYPLDRKPHAIGIITAAGFLARIIGAPAGALVSDIGGWRSTFSFLVFPISIAGVILALYFIPSTSVTKQPRVTKEPYWTGFKEILRSKSAIASLIFQVFFLLLYAIATFGIAFFKEAFNISTDVASGIMVGTAICGVFGSLVSGWLVVKFGRKNISVLTSLLSSMLAIVAFYMPNLWTILAFRYSSMALWAIALSASASLMLEQVPKYRGSMMSLRVAFAGIGTAIGVYIGSLVLTFFDYQSIGLILGSVGSIGSLILLFAVKDTCLLCSEKLPRTGQ